MDFLMWRWSFLDCLDSSVCLYLRKRVRRCPAICFKVFLRCSLV
nr:MAG TPA: hypothetical protein [Caudoviricetes sp.]